MPDLIFVQMQQCKSLSQNSYQIGKYLVTGLGSEGVYPRCTCPPYKYGKRTVNFGGDYYPELCKHIQQAEEERCGWHELLGNSQTKQQRERMICPDCGGETDWVNVGV